MVSGFAVVWHADRWMLKGDSSRESNHRYISSRYTMEESRNEARKAEIGRVHRKRGRPENLGYPWLLK